MYTLNEGYLNAGFIFLALALLATLIFGRFLCGWGCHVVAYQDLCAWLLKKVGIKPKPFRSRLLVFAPLALAFYMFFWPTVYRWFAGQPAPTLTNHLMTTEFWKTFPGAGIAALTVAVCGFAIVYFLGSKGFCTYGCPYGGLFGVADQLAVGRIRVTDACEHCGHCTAVCTSNVRVHEEVANFGMVVDPGCMKCMDCVSVCPNDALYFGYVRPRWLGSRSPRRANVPSRPRPYDFSLGEELLMAAVGLGALLAYRGLYGRIPLLLAMGMAAILGFTAVKCLQVVRTANVRFQNLQIRRGRRLTSAGVGFLVLAAALFLFTVHSAAVQWNSWSGHRLLTSVGLGDEVWRPDGVWWDRASPRQRADLQVAASRLSRADAWGLFSTPTVLQDLIWLSLASGDVSAAEHAVRRLVELDAHQPEPHRGLGNILRKRGDLAAAEAAYRNALQLHPGHARARQDLVSLLTSQGRIEEAALLYDQALSTSPGDADLAAESGIFFVRVGRPDAAIERLRRAIELDDGHADARYQLALLLLQGAPAGAGFSDGLTEAAHHLRAVVEKRPGFAEGHYNLAVATFMAGRSDEALAAVRQSIRLDPADPQAYGFLAVVLRETGDMAGAAQAQRQAEELGPRD
jgi:Flp pilus assembly protein TadD/ferredoxin